MDIVSIHELKVSTVVGAHAWERTIQQTLWVDLEFAAPVKVPAQTDALADAIDYSAVSTEVSDWIVARKAQLIETLAEGVALLLMTRFGVAWVKVSIWKPGAVPQARRVGVTIERGVRT
jgi:dihydroneopterin aldolase